MDGDAADLFVGAIGSVHDRCVALPVWGSVKDRYALKTGLIVGEANRTVVFHCRELQVRILSEVNECFPATTGFGIGDRYDLQCALRVIDRPHVEDFSLRR